MENPWLTIQNHTPYPNTQGVGFGYPVRGVETTSPEVYTGGGVTETGSGSRRFLDNVARLEKVNYSENLPDQAGYKDRVSTWSAYA